MCQANESGILTIVVEKYIPNSVKIKEKGLPLHPEMKII